MTVDNAMQTKLLCAFVSDPTFFAESVADLHKSDFTSLAARIVFETIRAHWRKYGSMPTANTLPDEVLNAIRGIGPDGKESIMTVIPQPLVPQVATCLGKVISALSHPNTSDTDYFRDRWGEYLAAVRIERLNGKGMSAKEQLEAAARMNDEINRISGGKTSDAETADKIRVLQRRTKQRKSFGTGVWPIDIRMDGGMLLGDFGCIIANTGVGKSNMLINFAVNAALCGRHVLFISLEIDKTVIMKRIDAMLGCFNVTMMNKTIEEWEEQYPKELERYEFLHSEFPYSRNITVNTDFTTRDATCADIERAIKAWKRQMHSQGISDEECPLVCIDYIRQMNFQGVASAKDNDNTKYGNIARRFKQLAIDNNCIIWTAQQTNRNAEKKQHLACGDIADSIAITHHCETVIGMTLVGVDPRTHKEIDLWDTSAKITKESEDDTKEKFSVKERLINIDFCKLRNSGQRGTYCTVFQSKSLRLYTSDYYADQTDEKARAWPLDKFYMAVKPKTVT